MAKIATSVAGSKRGKGFTLLELIVVLAIAALLVAVAPPLLQKALPGLELKSTARNIASGLKFARTHAIATRESAVLMFDLEQRSFSVTGRKKLHNIPEDLSIEIFTAEVEKESDARAGIRFFPTGGSTGGRVTLGYKARKYLVDVDWLTGKVRILEPET